MIVKAENLIGFPPLLYALKHYSLSLQASILNNSHYTIFHSTMVRVALSKFTPIFTIRGPSN